MSRAKTRFNPDDLKALRAKADEVRGNILNFSQTLLAANLSHTGGNFYDERVRRVSDRLNERLHAVDELLHDEQRRHEFATEEMTA